MIDKHRVIAAIIEQLQLQLNTAESAVKMAADTATHSETVAQNKYDTFGLEASYLAHGQQQRVLETQLAIQCFQQLLKSSDDSRHETVAIASLLILQEEQAAEKQHCFFIAAAAGGLRLTVDQQSITVVSTDAPLSASLMSKELDDEVMLAGKTCFIVDLC